MSTAFIIGSPRSGTTLLGDILDLHPHICRWYEPYFVLDRQFRDAIDDRRTAADATPPVANQVRTAFARYRRRRGCQVVVDKSPRNSLKLPFLHAIFPDAHFVHIVRDGRDVTLSIYREWQRRADLGSRPFSWGTLREIKHRLLDPQPLLRDKVAAARFEIGLASVMRGRGALHRVRWDGKLGWGPRFPGWRSYLDAVSTLEFNALQWVKCVNTVAADRPLIDPVRFLEVRYEDLLARPAGTLGQILDFLQQPMPPDFLSDLPPLRTDNTGKWRRGFSKEQLALIGPLLAPLLIVWGYASDDSWCGDAGAAGGSDLC